MAACSNPAPGIASRCLGVPVTSVALLQCRTGVDMKRTLTQMLFIAACAAAWAMALAACGGGGATSGSASQTVQSYLQARVQGELDKMINLSCAEWEAQARVEATSFKSMKA